MQTKLPGQVSLAMKSGVGASTNSSLTPGHCNVHRTCYIYYVVNNANPVNAMRESQLTREAERVLRGILKGLPEVHVRSKTLDSAADTGVDLTLDVFSGKARFRFCIQAKARVTPQTALSICDQFRGLPENVIGVLFAPTISPRVAEIVRGQGIGYIDQAGNCWLRSNKDHLLIEREGFQNARKPTPAAADPFSNKSSRIVRAVLSRPVQGWQVRKLADDPDVQVSPGLVVKVKRAFDRGRLCG